MAPGDQYYGKTIKGTAVLNRVVRRGLTKTVTFGKEKGKCREKKHALKKTPLVAPLSHQDKFLTLNIACGPGTRTAAWLRS